MSTQTRYRMKITQKESFFSLAFHQIENTKKWQNEKKRNCYQTFKVLRIISFFSGLIYFLFFRDSQLRNRTQKEILKGKREKKRFLRLKSDQWKIGAGNKI